MSDFSIENKLNELIDLMPPVPGNGWQRKQNEPDGTRVYEVRVKGMEDTPYVYASVIHVKP